MPEKKRPRGLAAQNAAKKKAKIDDDDAPQNTSNAQTVVLDKVVDEGDEVGEAAALLESALEKAEHDTTAALQLLRGTVHESDRILRNWEPTDSSPSPPPLFYLTYGSALYELGRLSEDEEFEPYLEAAEERLESGLERCGEINEANSPVANKLRVALCKVWLAKASGSLSEADSAIHPLATKALETLEDVFKSTDQLLSNAATVDVASIVKNHGDLYSELGNKTKFGAWAEKQLARVLEDEPKHVRALSELGLYHLALANYWLEQADEQDDEQDDDDTKKLGKESQQALEALVKSKDYFQRAITAAEEKEQVHPQLFADLAEVCLNEANLVEKEEEQTALYKQAVEEIERAKALADKEQSSWSLPEGLQMFMEEWESEDQ